MSPRIHLPIPLRVGETLTLPVEAVRHVVQALRMQAGEGFIAFNGEGGEYHCTLTAAGKSAQARVERFDPVSRESPLAVTIAQCISKGERMDYAMQKAAELGAARVVPVISARCVVRVDAERWEKKREHWQGVLVSAAEQCGRTRLPVLGPVLMLAEWLKTDDSRLKLVMEPEASLRLHQLAPPAGAVSLLVGPEGGLAAEEVAQAVAAGATAVAVGPRILRTETAGIAVLAALQAQWGDWR